MVLTDGLLNVAKKLGQQHLLTVDSNAKIPL